MGECHHWHHWTNIFIIKHVFWCWREMNKILNFFLSLPKQLFLKISSFSVCLKTENSISNNTAHAFDARVELIYLLLKRVYKVGGALYKMNGNTFVFLIFVYKIAQLFDYTLNFDFREGMVLYAGPNSLKFSEFLVNIQI